MKVLSFWPNAVAVVSDLLVLILVSFIVVVLSVAGVVACAWNVIMSRKDNSKSAEFKIYEQTDGGPLF